MKTTHVALFSIFLLSSSFLHAAGDDYELYYGPQGGKITLKNNPKFMAIKPYSVENEENLELIIGEDSKNFKKTSKLGGFNVLNYTGEDPDETLNRLRGFDTISQGTHVYYTHNDTSVPFVPTGMIYLKLKDDANPKQLLGIVNNKFLNIIEERGERELITAITKDSRNPIRTALEIQQEYADLVEVAEPELATIIAPKVFKLPTDSLFLSQWHLKNPGNLDGTSKVGADARVVEAWESMEGYGSPNITVAVIDNGFDLDHPDLSGDDKIVHPWDFEFDTNNPSPKNFNPDPQKSDWHGTACAGVAVGNLGGGSIIGAAPLSKLMPIRWGGELTDLQVERWFDYATLNGADIISCSWGAKASDFELSTRMSNAIRNSALKGRGGKGCVIVFAAGNDNRNINDKNYNINDETHNSNDHAHGTLDGFAVHPNVITVAASTSRDQKAYYSNFGKEISICAPSSGAGGIGIITSDVMSGFIYGGETYRSGYGAGDYTYFGGTSSACPLVAGISALVLSVNPKLTSAEVKEILEKTARRIGPSSSYKNKHSIYYGHGCINAEKAVRKASRMLSANVEVVLTDANTESESDDPDLQKLLDEITSKPGETKGVVINQTPSSVTVLEQEYGNAAVIKMYNKLN